MEEMCGCPENSIFAKTSDEPGTSVFWRGDIEEPGFEDALRVFVDEQHALGRPVFVEGSGDLNYGLNEVDEQLTELAALGVAYDGRDDPKYEMDGSVWQFRPGKPHYYHDADANGQVHWVAHQIKEVLERHGYGDLMRLFEAEDEAGFKALDDAPITY